MRKFMPFLISFALILPVQTAFAETTSTDRTTTSDAMKGDAMKDNKKH